MTLPSELYSAAQVRQLEARLIAAGVSGQALMERAGASAYAFMRTRWPDFRSIGVVCGVGNNGGDGFVLARLARQGGLSVQVLVVGDATRVQAEAREALAQLRATGAPVHDFTPAALSACDLVVDALLGIGVRAPLSKPARDAIEAMNAAPLPVLSLDLPSGLHPDTGIALPAVHATATMTFVALKQGLFLEDGKDHAGEIVLEALGCDATLAAGLPPALCRLVDEHLQRALPPRPRKSHKGMFGKVVVVGGGTGMPGAVRLAAEAALRVGAGLVTVASRSEHLQVVVGNRPELMFRSVETAGDVAGAIAGADVVVLGPGLGRDHWARVVLTATLAAVAPESRLIVDADALNLMAEEVGRQHGDDWILTPHPAEAARLLKVATADIQRDRMAALAELCGQRGGTIVLKGATTLVGQSGRTTLVCDCGNAGMSVPGMGDVLAGAIAGIVAQCRDPYAAAAAAVLAHATAGDRCARAGLRGMLAMEVAQELRSAVAALP
jgi:ADP-dependent NAD(P)H-hydrate dehydratase / NAD(P)H-hydrate epimerase